jgi:teichuronic acid biosynthesis glycosyltransferase TuaH
VVLVGPEDEAFQNSELHQIENVHFLGSKKMEELPNYLYGFDVALNPQKLNEVTIGNYPRKIDEYLAMGKPTVATKTKAMEVFADYVYLANNKEEYVDLIDRALKENTPEKEIEREKLARSHTWDANAEAIYEKIEAIEKIKENGN